MLLDGRFTISSVDSRDSSVTVPDSEDEADVFSVVPVGSFSFEWFRSLRATRTPPIIMPINELEMCLKLNLFSLQVDAHLSAPEYLLLLSTFIALFLIDSENKKNALHIY
jgi:hypothetical protein